MIIRSCYTRLLAAGITVLAAGSLAAVAAVTPSTVNRISIGSGAAGAEGNAASFGPVDVTANGRITAFSSFARNFYALDTNSFSDIYIRDSASNFTSIVSLGNPTGGSGSINANRQIANGDSSNPSISPGDGRYVAFQSLANNLVTGDTNAASDVFVRDRFGDVVRVSALAGGGQGTNAQGSFAPSISDPVFDPSLNENHLFTAYHSDVDNLDGADDNTASDVFVTEIGPSFTLGSLQVLDTTRISVATDGTAADGDSKNASISADGRYVVFQSEATDLVDEDTNGTSDIFLADRVTNTIVNISAERDDDGALVEENDGESILPTISADGNYIAYVSDGTLFDGDDVDGYFDVFVYDRINNITTLVSVDDGGAHGDADSGIVLDNALEPTLAGRPSISNDGELVTFVSDATNLVAGDENEGADVFVHEVSEGITTRVSVGPSQSEDGDSTGAAISGNGGVISFASDATNLIGEDGNLFSDIFSVTTGIEGGGTGGPNTPVADAGNDFTVNEADEVELDGSNSTDPEDDELTYLWTQVAGPTVELTDADTANPTFTAPLVQNQPVVLRFQLIVSDGVNTSEADTVEVLVDFAPAGTIFGVVNDPEGNPVVGATVFSVREDGEEVETTTNGAGLYTLTGVRAGLNTVTFSAPGYEPIVEEVDLAAGADEPLDVEFSDTTATIGGTVLLQNGSPLAAATVRLVSAQGVTLAQDTTDSDGGYLLEDLDSIELENGATVVLTSAAFPTWTVSEFDNFPGEENELDFRYGRLEVTVDTKPASQRKKLNGTTVTVRQGSTTIATGTASAKQRKVVFQNIPAVTVRAQAANPNLGGVATDTTINPGGVRKITLKLNKKTPF